MMKYCHRIFSQLHVSSLLRLLTDECEKDTYVKRWLLKPLSQMRTTNEERQWQHWQFSKVTVNFGSCLDFH